MLEMRMIVDHLVFFTGMVERSIVRAQHDRVIGNRIELEFQSFRPCDQWMEFYFRTENGVLHLELYVHSLFIHQNRALDVRGFFTPAGHDRDVIENIFVHRGFELKRLTARLVNLGAALVTPRNRALAKLQCLALNYVLLSRHQDERAAGQGNGVGEDFHRFRVVHVYQGCNRILNQST